MSHRDGCASRVVSAAVNVLPVWVLETATPQASRKDKNSLAVTAKFMFWVSVNCYQPATGMATVMVLILVSGRQMASGSGNPRRRAAKMPGRLTPASLV